MPPFRVSRAGGSGHTYKATRHRVFRTPTTGVRLLASEADWIDDLRALALVLRDDAAFSHFTAAILHGLPLPLGCEHPFHVTVPRGAARGERTGVRWHQAAALSPMILEGLPVTDPARTWHDLGPLLPLPELVAVDDRIMRRRLVPTLGVIPGVRNAAHLRHALNLSDGRSRSPRESILRVHLRLAGLPASELNFDVIHRGEWIGCGDLVWPLYRVYVEYDGEHHADPKQRHQDAQTRNRLAQLGWQVRVVTKAMDPHDVVEMVGQALMDGGWAAA